MYVSTEHSLHGWSFDPEDCYSYCNLPGIKGNLYSWRAFEFPSCPYSHEGLSYQSRLWCSSETSFCSQVWDLSTFACVKTLRGHNKPVQVLQQRHGLLYSIGGRKIRIWDLTTFCCLKNIHTQDDGGAMRALAVGSDGTIYVGGQVTTTNSLKTPLNEDTS